MCLAIVKPAGIVIPEDYLREGYSSNPHGAGMAYAEKGQLKIHKGFFNIDRFLENYRAIEHLPALIHFRLATHGKKNSENCHPFAMIDNTYAVIHNGIINIQSTEDLSDTGHFVKLVMEPMVRKVPIQSKALKYLIEQAVGSFNRLAVLNSLGEHVIFNEDEGHWHEGVWYSNKGYLPSMMGFQGDIEWLDSRGTYHQASRTDRPSSEREDTIKEIMRIESCSRLDAEYMEESGWPWDYDYHLTNGIGKK